MSDNAKKISAVGIKKLWYFDVDKINDDLTGEVLAKLLEEAKEIVNIHQDTWNIEETEASQDTYRNQLTGMVYRTGTKTMGDISFAWTIGQYDYFTKAEFLGGTATETSWKRARGVVQISKALVALTEDGQYCVLTNANVTANESNADKAVGLAVKGTAMEHSNPAISSEYWFDSSEVSKGTAA